MSDGSIAIALGVSTCPSPDPIDASIERKLHDADAALVHINAAITRGTETSSQYFRFRERSESFIRSVEGLSDFITGVLPFEDRVRRETAGPAALDGMSGELTGLGINVREDKAG